MSILLGAIGDDFTGSTDLALTLGKHGMNVQQYIGVPKGPVEAEDIQGAIVALKSRTVPVKDAVQQSMDACDWLLAQGPDKSCSNIVRPSIPPKKGISARWRKHYSIAWTQI